MVGIELSINRSEAVWCSCDDFVLLLHLPMANLLAFCLSRRHIGLISEER